MYLTISILFVLIILSLVIEKNFFNPIIIFSTIWMLIFIFQKINLYDMIEPSFRSLTIIKIGVFSFLLGALLVCLWGMIKKDNNELKTKSKKYEINFKAINIILILGIILTIPVVVKVTSLLLDGIRYSDIRAMYYSYGDKTSLISNEALFTIFDWGTAIILSAVTPIIIVGLFNDKVNCVSLLLLGIFTLLYIYATSGRSQLFIIIIELLLVMFFNYNKIDKKRKKNIIVSVILVSIIISIVTGFRNKSSKSEINQIYAYLSIPAPYFSHLVDQIDRENTHTYGLASTYGPYLIVQKTVKLCTGYKFPIVENLHKLVNKPQNFWVKIFRQSTDKYNAYGTMFYNFYLDFGLIGVILFSLVYGILIQRIYMISQKRKSILYQVIYIMLCTGLINSFIRWQFSSPIIIMSLCLVFVLIRTKQVTCESKSKILVFGMTENPGGIESVIMNYYRNIDRDKIQFDFLCNTEQVAYQDEIINLGGTIYRVTPRSKNKISFYKELKSFFKENAQQYSTIWVNVCSLANIDYLRYAKKYGISKRIIHCHNSQNMDSFMRGILHRINKIILPIYANHFWSCDFESSSWFFNKSIINGPKYLLVKNAIDCNKFTFDEKVRNQYREEMNVKDKIVLGNIGRFHFQKNQMFLLEIFSEFKKINDNCILFLIGDGEDKNKIINKINELNLEESVKVLGIRNDVNNLIQAMDAFVFPSLFEGYPLVLVETQSNGLPIFASDSITNKIKMSKNLQFISLDKSAKEWAEIIFEDYKNNRFKREDNYEEIVKNGFEIGNEVKKLESFFERN